jgi:hypothetical protein
MTNSTVPAVLSRDDLRRIAPSVFASQPWHGMSGRYRMVPTIEVADILRDRGFFPVRADQSRSRIEGKGDFTRHMIRFRHADHLTPTNVGTDLPELVLTNSHDGTAAYRFNSGIFRLVCSNGLLVASADFGGISVKHSGGQGFHDRIIDATFRIIEQTPRTLDTIERWKQITLPRTQQLALAEAAMELKPNASIRPAFLLTARRDEDLTAPDASRDLWRTLNVLQENLMRGGIQGQNERGRRIRTRPTRSVVADIKINRALWRLAEEMAELAGPVP